MLLRHVIPFCHNFKGIDSFICKTKCKVIYKKVTKFYRTLVVTWLCGIFKIMFNTSVEVPIYDFLLVFDSSVSPTMHIVPFIGIKTSKIHDLELDLSR